MDESVKVIVLERAPTAHADGSVPGTLHVGDTSFPTIERGGGYVTLKIGDYVMEHSWKKTGRRVKCLRPVQKEIDTILIHDARYDSSTELKGCISPGMAKKPFPGQGILDAEGAMNKLWKLLGGYVPGRRVTLHVLNNVIYSKKRSKSFEV